MKKYKIAAILMIIHGGFMEIGGSLALIPVRIVGAIGLLKNRMWGLVLSLINSILTMALMMFMLPVGIIDGIFACSTLILILIEFFGDKSPESFYLFKGEKL